MKDRRDEDASEPSPMDAGDRDAAHRVEDPETKAIPALEIDLLRGWMTSGDDDDDDGEDRIEIGRDALDTIPLPTDELDRLLVLTRGRLAFEDAALNSSMQRAGGEANGRRDRMMTLLSDGGEGAKAPGTLPPRAMRGVEILLGVPVSALREGRATSARARDVGRGAARRKRRSRWLAPALAVAATALPAFAIATGAYFLRGAPRVSEPSAALAATAPVEALDRPVEAPQTAAPAAAPGAGAAGERDTGDALSNAQAALRKLRAGVLSCARETIGVLPGTSPPVPASLRLAKGEGYASSSRDWGSPVWSCAGFDLPEPQHFQIQWQMLKTNVEGMGVAWIDEDHDGVPDRALAFKALLKDRGQAEAGDIEPIDPGHPIASAAQ